MGRLSVLLLAAAIASLVQAEDFHFFGHEYDRTALGDAIDRVSTKFLKEAYDTQSNKNLISSPLGVLTLLSLYAAGADGPIREEITSALGSSDYPEMFSSYSELSRTFSDLSPELLTLANRVYVSDKFSLADPFVNIAIDSYRSGVDKLNFDNPSAAAAEINRWAEEQTHGHIKNAVSADALDASVAAALFNVIYFKGHWGVPFNASETKDEEFHLDSSRTVLKPMMRLTSTLFYHESESLGAKLLELPYKEDNFRMIVVMPNDIEGLPSVMEKVYRDGLLPEVFQIAPAGFEIELHMPKFEINTDLDLQPILSKLGVSKIFTDGATGIVKEAPVRVTKAFQKAFVNVDEEGATAGAFTGEIFRPVSSYYEMPVKIRVDHPFLFAILNQDKILFLGTYSNLGVSKIFTDGATGIVKEASVRVTKAFQKAFVNVDEEGATAGAFTGEISRPVSSYYEMPVKIRVDHPFLFAILNQDKILFLGTYSN